ncbi:MAG TPA: DUF302 domain-containing protein [Puia sp.]|nr:DUF302 domain-containing protein [Puia sp.]
MDPAGILQVQSKHTVHETANRLENILRNAGATVYARIDQEAELKKAGLAIRPMEFILFGNPAAGGPVIMQNPLVALDLPLKLLILENDKNETWIIYNDASYIGDRYKLQQGTYSPFVLDKIIQRAIIN